MPNIMKDAARLTLIVAGCEDLRGFAEIDHMVRNTPPLLGSGLCRSDIEMAEDLNGIVIHDLAAVVEPDGRVRTARAVRVVLSRPRAISEAMTLRSGTNAALKAVAAALGKVARA